MPLIVKDFKWKQTEALVTIQLPLHGVHQSKVDLFTSPKYIKASYEQYFFEAFLLHAIQTSSSKCTLTPTEIVFELLKCERLLWDKLESEIPKTEKMLLKRQIIEEEHRRLQKELEEKRIRKSELKRVAVGEQISLDGKQRELIESIKESEKAAALGNLAQWHGEAAEPKIVELLSSDEDEDTKVEEIRPIVLKRSFTRGKKLPVASDPIPLPRKTATLKVDFSARQFPTPSRESQLEEETEWLRKQAEVKRSVGFNSDDLRPEEKNPQYLKAKGEEFLKAGNFLGAISAFSFGIKLAEQYPDLYIGRSQAHFELGNFYKSAQDCSMAIELLRPAVPSNLDQRVTCISRRGMALWKLGLVKEGLSELEVAVKLHSNDETLKEQLDAAKKELSSLEDS